MIQRQEVILHKQVFHGESKNAEVEMHTILAIIMKRICPTDEFLVL